MAKKAVVTGAFSYIGAAVAAELVSRGYEVSTLTNRTPPPGSKIRAAPLRFDSRHLQDQLVGADLFVNTYWVRIPYAGESFQNAVDNSAVLFAAAAAAHVGRVVHVSVSNPTSGLNLGYYAGKAKVEERLRASRLSWGIVRPTLVVGPGDVLTNNIAWLLRRFPFFPVPNGGLCKLQPVTLADTARIVADVAQGTEAAEVDAAGPEAMTFWDYVQMIADACRLSRLLVSLPGWLSLGGLSLIEPLLGDVVLTEEELLGLEQELLLSHEPPLGTQSVRHWLQQNAESLGRAYVNDVRRHFGAGSDEAVLDPQRLAG
ncbi:MAG: epimerase [Myxococcales bacterium]